MEDASGRRKEERKLEKVKEKGRERLGEKRLEGWIFCLELTILYGPLGCG